MALNPAEGDVLTVTAARKVRVVEVVDETADARSIVVQPEEYDAPLFSYRPGQFLTVRVPDVGSGGARCYSLASSPHSDTRLKFTVKRVVGGHGSNWLCDSIGPGDHLDVLPPAGTFTPTSVDENVVLIAGGSGITPVMSIAKSILFGGIGDVVLIYANRDQDSVIFAAELRDLERAFGSRLTVIHVMESVQGFMSRAMLVRLIGRDTVDRSVYICGPTPLMDLAVDASAAAGIASDRVHSERFLSLSSDPFAHTPSPDIGSTGDVVATIEVSLDGEHHRVNWSSGQRMLDALLAGGVNAPYSCREGACSACVCAMTSGEVRMVHNQILEQEDIEDGYVLPCQAEPVSDRVVIEY